MRNKILILLLGLCMISCVVVKHDIIEDDSGGQKVNLSPMPTVEMSDETVRSIDNDMIAFLPKDWFFVDVGDRASSNIFAVAVNPDYTLSAVFSQIPNLPEYSDVLKREGMIGLTRIAFERHNSKVGGSATMIGSPSLVNMGPLEFGKYSFSGGGTTEKCQAVVFRSASNNLYEFALMPMSFRMLQLPAQDEINQYFNSILATIQY